MYIQHVYNMLYKIYTQDTHAHTSCVKCY